MFVSFFFHSISNLFSCQQKFYFWQPCYFARYGKYFTLKILYTYILLPDFSIKILIYSEIPYPMCALLFMLNPSTPISDEHLIYPNGITPE